MAQEPPIRIMCPALTCRRVLAVPANARGKTVRCRCCGASIRVPDNSGSDSKPGSEGKRKAG